MKSYCDSQEFSVGEVSRNVVWLGSQRLPVPVLRFRQLVQAHVGFTWGSQGQIRGHRVTGQDTKLLPALLLVTVLKRWPTAATGNKGLEEPDASKHTTEKHCNQKTLQSQKIEKKPYN